MFSNREKLENLAILRPWGHDFDLSEKLTEIVVLSFLTSEKKNNKNSQIDPKCHQNENYRFLQKRFFS